MLPLDPFKSSCRGLTFARFVLASICPKKSYADMNSNESSANADLGLLGLEEPDGRLVVIAFVVVLGVLDIKDTRAQDP
jgi:hypothetical protein